MSARHMPGKLQVAVEVFDNDGFPETVIQGMGGAASVAVALDFGPNNPGMRYANARRLVACWNACEGVPIEVLEAQHAGGLPWNVADQIDQRIQRDKLQADFDAYKEGSEQAFGAVVEQKRDLEASEARMRQTIDGQQAAIVRMRKQRNELLAMLEAMVWEDDGLIAAADAKKLIAKVKAE